MIRSALLAIAMIATPVLAAAPQFQAEPVARPAETRIALRDTLWRCGDAGCTGAGESVSRPAIVCAVLAKEVGALKSFAVKGEALDADELERCNARAKKITPGAAQAASR